MAIIHFINEHFARGKPNNDNLHSTTTNKGSTAPNTTFDGDNRITIVYQSFLEYLTRLATIACSRRSACRITY